MDAFPMSSPRGDRGRDASFGILVLLHDQETWSRPRLPGPDEDGIAAAGDVEDYLFGSLEDRRGEGNIGDSGVWCAIGDTDGFALVVDADPAARAAVPGGSEAQDDLLAFSEFRGGTEAAELDAEGSLAGGE